MTSTSSFGQPVETGFLSHTSPQPAYQTPEPAKYNIKWGKLTARFNASLQTEFNDNINLSDRNPHRDISFGPDVRVGFVYPLSDIQLLQFNLGAGYRWYLNSPANSSVNIDPKSRLDYKIIVMEDIQINFYDSFSVQTDPLSRSDISGGSSDLLNFRRLNNTAGIQAYWHPTRQLGITGGYSYTIDRSLSDQFTSIDRNDHSVNAGIFYTFSPRWTAAVNASYTRSHYLQNIQNDGVSYSIGPSATYKPSEFITIEGSVGYTVSSFDQTGTIGDTSEFKGVTAQGAIRHTLNSRMSHELRASKNQSLGLGSNFNETWLVQYGFDTRLRTGIKLDAKIAYESFSASNVGAEQADRFLFYLGTGWQLTRVWSFGIGYAFALKNSNLPDRNYIQNRLTLDLTRQF